MTKFVSTIGFCTGLLILGLAYFTAPGASSVEAREGAAACHVQEVALDEGYGVSRTELRKVCPPAR